MDSTISMKSDVDFRRNLELMRESGTFCDAKICIPGEVKTLPVHRAVMSSCSDFFRSLFTNGLEETMQHDVKIHDVPLKIMEIIVHYAYTREVILTENNVEDIFIAADRFNVLGLLADCINFFSSKLRPENIIGILRFAKIYNCKRLKDICWMYVTSHFKEITDYGQEFIELDASELLEIIADDKLNVQTEDDVYFATMKWIDFSARERKQHCKTLLSAVRFLFVTEDCFDTNIMNNRDLKRSPGWERIQLSYNLVKKFRSSKNPLVKSRTKELARWIKPRIPSHIIFVFGGWAKDGVTHSVETYDRNTDQWFVIRECELPQPRAYHGTATVHDKVYVLGGFNGACYLNSVICFDASKKVWEERAPMYMSRCYVSSVEIDGMIYACGGYDGRVRHSSAEKYDSTKNQWTLVKPMYHQRSDAGATNYKGKLYIAGGFDGTSCLFSAEVYDPQADQWTILAPMSTRRSGVSLAVCDNRVYAVGGYDGQRRLETVEYLETSNRHWYTGPSMILGRSNFSCVVINNIIYAMGGYDGEKTSSEVECFHSGKKMWFALNNMNIGRSAISACTVCDIYNAHDYSFHGNETLVTSIDKLLCAPMTTEENVEFAKHLINWSLKSPVNYLESSM